MTRRLFLIFAGLLATSIAAQAGTISYLITVTGSNISANPGFIDMQFNQANSLTSLSATATISSFNATGYAFGSPQTSPGVTGSIASLPIIIPNDQAPANFYTQGVNTWGSSFSFLLTLSGAAVGGSAADGSTFFLSLLDNGFNPIAGSLANGAIATIDIDGSGGATAQGGSFGVGTAAIVQLPEPGNFFTSLSMLGVVALLHCRRLRRRVTNVGKPRQDSI